VLLSEPYSKNVLLSSAGNIDPWCLLVPRSKGSVFSLRSYSLYLNATSPPNILTNESVMLLYEFKQAFLVHLFLIDVNGLAFTSCDSSYDDRVFDSFSVSFSANFSVRASKSLSWLLRRRAVKRASMIVLPRMNKQRKYTIESDRPMPAS